MMNKKDLKRLEYLAPRNKHGKELGYSIDDLKLLQQTVKVAEKRTNRIALELVIGMSVVDALAAAYLQGFNDAQISC